MDIRLDGKVALVTGGYGAIGTAMCKALADSGCKVASNYRNREKAEKWQAQCREEGYEFGIYEADVTDFDACGRMAEAIEKELGPIDILVNNAGMTWDGSFRKMTREQWDTVIRTNLDSVFNVTRHIAPGMTERGWGRIINVSSINGQKGQFGQVNYSASKAGMHGFTMALAQEVARKGVTVNTLSPGYIATEMVMKVPQNILDQVIAQIPVGRLGTCEEVAAAVVFLASEQAAFINGANIAQNGGQHMH
ncbi:MAG: acetoacetyl-CoA reductase [Gammaproteobacteria bacterium]|nr:MAG: acetoacetyl-CoA reductase [Gammaproteobacteria bacterium]